MNHVICQIGSDLVCDPAAPLDAMIAAARADVDAADRVGLPCARVRQNP